jgi:phospholipid transport system substrate-binding protein
LAGAIAMPAWSADDSDDAITAPIRAFYDALLDVMRRADELRVKGRYDKLQPVLLATFDLAAMTRISVGPPWTSLPADTQAALIDAFTRMTIATYASRFDGYSGEHFEIDPEVESRNAGRIVRTKLIKSDGTAIFLNYLMRQSGGKWKVVDVYLIGMISELATRRTEFSAILDSSGPQGLIDSLRQQTDKLMRS